MGELNVFGFKTGNSMLHRLDVRFKLMFFVLISLSSLKANIFSLSLLTIVLAAALIHAGLAVKSALKDLPLYFFAAFICLYRSIVFRTRFSCHRDQDHCRHPGRTLPRRRCVLAPRDRDHDRRVFCFDHTAV